MMKYLYNVTTAVEQKLKRSFPSKFGLIIDGWSQGSTHYFGVYGSFVDGTPLLAFAPPFNEEQFSAQTQVDFIGDCLEVYGKTLNDIIFLVADNTNVNPATARLIGCAFIGCSSHRFNLAAKEYFLEYEPILSNIHLLMKKLCTLKFAGALRKRTPLNPITRNVTRWSSTYAMLDS
jgi:hypothetical protein